jgi:hypothetical protein
LLTLHSRFVNRLRWALVVLAGYVAVIRTMLICCSGAMSFHNTSPLEAGLDPGVTLPKTVDHIILLSLWSWTVFGLIYLLAELLVLGLAKLEMPIPEVPTPSFFRNGNWKILMIPNYSADVSFLLTPKMYVWISGVFCAGLVRARRARETATSLAHRRQYRSRETANLLTGRFRALLSGRFHS